MVKQHVRAMQVKGGVVTIDDSIFEKPYTDENELVCWHYDHAKERTVKGINVLNVLNDVWFAAAENMRFGKLDLAKAFIMALKANRKVALTLADKQSGC